MSIETKVRNEFERLAGEVRPRTEGWAEIQGRIRRDVTRRVALASVLGAAALAGIGFAVARLDNKVGVTIDPPGVTNGRIAFVRSDPATVREGRAPTSALYSVSPDGRGLTRLADGIIYRSRPAWSPDGSKIAFERSSDILVTNTGGTATNTLVDCVPGACGAHHPDWSPDGSRVAFMRLEGTRVGVYVVPAGGGVPTAIRDDFLGITDLSWSPDGRRIAVAGRLSAEAASNSIHIISVDNGEVLSSTDLPARLELGETVAWSPDGSRLVIDATGAGGSCEGAGIYLVLLDGSEPIALRTGPSGQQTCEDVYPAWSPDGKEIVYTRAVGEFGSDGFIGDVYAIEIATGRYRQVTAGPGLDCCPSWQPLFP